MTDREFDCPRCGHCCPQPNQEPVAWMYELIICGEVCNVECTNVNWNPEYKPFGRAGINFVDGGKVTKTPLYTAPRQWVGLTDEEIKSLPSWWPSYEDAPALIQLVKDVEAKLKEKNT